MISGILTAVFRRLKASGMISFANWKLSTFQRSTMPPSSKCRSLGLQ